MLSGIPPGVGGGKALSLGGLARLESKSSQVCGRHVTGRAVRRLWDFEAVRNASRYLGLGSVEPEPTCCEGGSHGDLLFCREATLSGAVALGVFTVVAQNQPALWEEATKHAASQD